jgi:chemotaxis protein CheD
VLAESLREEPLLYVEPGQLLACTEPRRLRTILGSCVSVCLYDPSLRIGGMNHFMLPRAPQADVLSFRYGDRAMAGLVERLERLGSDRRSLSAHVYGGARMLSAISDLLHLGQGNVDFAVEWLDQRGIPILSSDVLGSVARRLEFDVQSGACSFSFLGAK